MIPVTCTLVRDGMAQIVQADVRVTPPDAVGRQGNLIIAQRAGDIAVACALPNLIDSTPALVHVLPGPPLNLRTSVAPNPVTAGQSITATCQVSDAFGNPITDASPTLALMPSDPGNTITNLSALMTRAGHFQASCQLAGATGNGVDVQVVPALPAHLMIGKLPDLGVYPVGDVVQITHMVADRYGNSIDNAPLTITSTAITGVGPITTLAPDQFRYGGEGRYQVNASVDPPTDGNLPVTASLQLVVNSLPPVIHCDSPADASMLSLAPGSMISFAGSASDVNGVASVSVNGTPVTLATDGTFQVSLPTRFGINFVDVSASDSYGVANSKVCAFLVADQWQAESGSLAHAVSLSLRQAAWDDGSRAGGLDDFDDILSVVLNSAGLASTLDGALLAANPLKPSSCDQQVCVPLIGCACVLSSEVTYLSSQLPGPNTASLTLVAGGVQAHARVSNIRLVLRVRGSAAGIGFDTTGTVDISQVDIDLILDAGLDGAGRPAITVRPGSVSVSVGSISTNFSGISGAIINLIASLAQGTLRNLVANTLQNFITNNFNSVLAGLVSGLNISNLGATFGVPRIGGAGAIPVSFGVGFSLLDTSASRMLVGLSTRFTAMPAQSIPSLGVPLPPGSVLLDPGGATSTAVGAHVGIFNQLLHTLWRAGEFDGALSGVVFETHLPPVALIDPAGTVTLQLGGVVGTANVSGLPADLRIALGATAHTTVSLVGDALTFGSITIDELHVSSDALSLDAGQQAMLESMLRPLVQQYVDRALNGSLPALPIPSFTIPSSLGAFGLPVGAQLGITSPSLSVSPQHFLLQGGFGVR